MDFHLQVEMKVVLFKTNKKMKKETLHEFDLASYPIKLWIAVSKSKFEDILDDVSDFSDISDPITEYTYDKKTGKGGVLIRFASKKEMNIENITHESIHAAMDIFSYIGANVNLEDQECFSYLCGYIADCCDKVRKGE